ncbi:MAG TPA: universal stress protein [Steroidobacteraceae bacterium]|nr:universal stress protein [Steroidobacteraceae bacterium]
MNKPSFILVVVDRAHDASEPIAKAVALARQSGARIELFLCESELAYELAHAYDREGIDRSRAASTSQARTYLADLKALANAPDLDITLDVSCESPMYEGIVRKVLHSRPDLVIKGTAGRERRRRTLDPNDWQLARTCPLTVMLTRGRPWRHPPRFAAAVDASEQESGSLSQDVITAARTLASAAQARLEVLYAESGSSKEFLPLRMERLRSLCEAAGITSDRMHVLHGAPEQTLLPFARAQVYDALILGALTHHRADSVPLGTLTSQLLDTLDCDFILVKPAGYRSPVGVRPAAGPQRCVG